MTTKNLLIFCLLILVLSSCDHAIEKKENDSAENIFTKSVGGPISSEVAARWVERKIRASGRQESFSVTADNLNVLLERVDNKLGVILHHAQNPDGEHHIFIAPVKSDLQSWSNGEVLDATSNEFVDASLASGWAFAHKALNPQGPWSHFYGIDLFDEITSTIGFSRMDIMPGEDDGGQSPILLYVWTESSIANGKIKSEASVYDRGAVCPPVCPANE